MQLPPNLLSTGELRIDWSGFSRILECHRKAWHLLCHRRELDGYAAALTYGSAIHAGLDVWQQHLMTGSTDRSAILSAMEAAAATAFTGIEVPDGEWRTLGRAIETLGLYVDARWDEDRTFNIIESEKYHERTLGVINPRGLRPIHVIWQGKIDGVWEDPRNGNRIIKDSKTSSKQFELHGPSGGPGRDVVRYQQSGQFQGYCFLTSSTAAIVDIITGLPPLQRPTAKSPPRNSFDRQTFEWTADQLSAWQRRTLHQINQWLEAIALGDPTLLFHTNACAWPTVCPYYSACEQKTEEMRMRWLASGRFRDYTWNPAEEKQNNS